MSYLEVSTKEVIKKLRPLVSKSVDEIQVEISGIRETSERILAASKNPDPSPADIIITQEAIRETRKHLNDCLDELRFRN
jgi:hypothetical protein